jgi:superfamily I DNA and/or RNA helicase
LRLWRPRSVVIEQFDLVDRTQMDLVMSCVGRGMDFLLSRNRVNVAISRGKWCAIVVRSVRLTDYLPSNPEGLGQLGAFIGLCTNP